MKLPRERASLGTDAHVTHVLKIPPTRWDRQIIADLVAEMGIHFAEDQWTSSEIRSELAKQGYRALQQRIEVATKGKEGADAIRAMAVAMRSFGLGSPGLAAASFRNPDRDSAEWLEAGKPLLELVVRIFAGYGFEGDRTRHAIRILRSLVRGFVLNEMSSGASDTLDYQRSFVLAIDLYIEGLSALSNVQSTPCNTEDD